MFVHQQSRLLAMVLWSGFVVGPRFVQAHNEQPAIDLEVAMQPGAPITAPQAWARRLGQLELGRVQIRSARGNELPAVTLNERGTRIAVLALLNARDELLVPGRRFGAGDLPKLKAYLEQLPREVAEGGVERGLFELTESQFNLILGDLEKPLSLSTVGVEPATVLRHCESKFQTPMVLGPRVEALLQTASPLEGELKGLSSGTALAIALRTAGAAFRPQEIDTDHVQLVVLPYQREADVWPAGWKTDQSPRQLAPQLFESLSIEIDGYTLQAALDALTPRLAVPVVMDSWTLRRKAIEPAEIQVKLPRKKTYLKGAVNRLLSQARLASELRIDERGRPWLWVTQWGPDSRPAAK